MTSTPVEIDGALVAFDPLILKGDPGPTGIAGALGGVGATTNLTMGTVGTVPNDQPASASLTGVAPNQVLNLVLPAGPELDLPDLIAELDDVFVPIADAVALPLAVTDLDTTGTASSSTYLRGDGAWTSPPGGAPSGTAGGDLSGTFPNPGVAKINGTALSGLSTGILKNTTTTGVPSIAVAGTDYAAATSGSAILKGNGAGGFSSATSGTDYAAATEPLAVKVASDIGGSAAAPTVIRINGTSLAGLATGVLKNTTTTGVPSIAVAADIPTVAAGSTGPLSAADATVNGQVAVNTQTSSYTLVLADMGKVVEMNNASANNLTVPLNSSVAYPIGAVIEIFQLGAGQTTVVATGGVTIRNPSSLTARAQYSTLSLRKRGTDEWVLSGDMT